MNGKLALLLLSLYAGVNAFAAPSESEEDDDPNRNVQIVVLAVSRTYEGTRTEAMKVAAELGFAFSDRDMVYTEEDGLHWPSNYEDDMWAGGYFPRRGDDACDGRLAKNGCITIEKSDSYPGLKDGYYIAIAGLFSDEYDAKERLAEVRHVARDATLHDTTVYMGCLH